MPNPASLARLKALEVLGDGEWKDYRAVVREVAAAVPPGVANRRAERQRVRSNARNGTTVDRRYRNDTGRLIEIGGMSIAREVLLDASTFEIEPRGTRTYVGPKKIRLIPAKVPPKEVRADGQ